MLSLQNKCKSIVFDNFDRYHEAYTKVTSSRDKLKYVFLQRKYSNELIKKLDDEGKLDNPNSKYFDFVINRYLKTLDTCYIEEIEWKMIRRKFSEIGPNLEKISFDERPWEDVICYLCNLQHVTFFPCTDSFLNCIAKFCPKIQSIEIHSANISSKGLQEFSCQADGTYACPNLKEIIFHPYNFGTALSNIKELIAYLLQNVTMLEHIKCVQLPEVLYSMYKDHIHSLNNIKPHYNLTKLCLMADVDYFWNRELNLDDLLKICISVCPNIKSLKCRVFTKKHLTLISKFDKLQELLLKNEGRCLDIDDFLQLKGNMLISLKVSYVHFSPIILLSNCSQLSILKMNVVRWPRNEKFGGFPIIGNLKELSMTNFKSYHRPLPSQVACFLASFPNLERLQLDSFDNDLEVQASILRAPKLQYLCFGEYVISNFLKDILLTSKSLTTLNLKKTTLLSVYGGLLGRRGQGVSMKELIHIAGTLINQPVILVSPCYRTIKGSDSDMEEEEEDDEDEEKELEYFGEDYSSGSDW